MIYEPLCKNRNGIIKEVMKIRKRSERYKKINEVVGLPNLITREVYQDEELAVEIICTDYKNVEKSIDRQIIEEVLKKLC